LSVLCVLALVAKAQPGALPGGTIRSITLKGPNRNAPLTLTISPKTASVSLSNSSQFTATVTNATNKGMTWSISPKSGAGTINQSGKYTAPASLPSNTTVTITTTSQQNSKISASATVTITSNESVSVSPQSATVATGAHQSFTATVSGSSTNTAVTWSAVSGTINSSGLYTAPATVPAGGTDTVTATSNAAPTKKATATVTITSSVSVSVSPQSTTLNTSAQRSFAATVSGSSTNTAVTWSAVSGTINASSGLYTAPATVPTGGTDTITATSNADSTSKGTATVKVTSGSNSTLSVATNSLHLAYIEQPYTAVLTGAVGAAPYTWSASAGALPSGLSLDSTTGQLTGTPTEGGSFSVTFTATDANKSTGSKDFTLTVFEQPLDQYGGLVNALSTGGATGYFRTEKSASGKWRFVDPSGNYFWLQSLYQMDAATNDSILAAVNAKYGGHNTTSFVNPEMRKIRSYGFNSLADSTTYSVDFAPGMAAPMPWIYFANGSYYSSASSGYGNIKNIFGAVSSYYTGYVGFFPDIYDPTYASQYQAHVNPAVAWGSYTYSTDAWIIGASTDDADYLTGFKDSPSCSSNPHPNLGFVVATMNFASTQTGAANTTMYTKTAGWIPYLQAEYGTVTALNTAWGTGGFYTAFGDAGGFGTGTGVQDEDGRHSWIGTDPNGLTNTNATVAADMNGFLHALAVTYFSNARTAIKTWLPNQLVFSPASLGACTRSQILTAAAQYVDVIEVGTVWPSQPNLLSSVYNTTGKPLVLWTTYTSQADSPYAGDTSWGSPIDQPTQLARGQAYQNAMQTVLALTGSDGSYPVAGIKWWQWCDNTGESENFGLVSVLENAYDGLEDVIAAGVDASGYATGGEAADHGDFLDQLTEENLTILRAVATAP